MSRVKNQQPKKTILALLKGNSEFELYKMRKATGLSYPTILKHLKLLENENLVSYRTERSNKGGKDKKIYTLTPRGLAKVYSPNIINGSLTLSIFEQVAREYRCELPFLKKIDEWKLRETPTLAKSILYAIAPFSDICSQNDYEPELLRLLLSCTFMAELKAANTSSLFAQHISGVLHADTFQDEKMIAQLQSEAFKFIENNPWVKQKIKDLVKDWLEGTERELKFLQKFSDKVFTSF